MEEERHLELHADKCHFMLISHKHIHVVAPPPLFVKVDTPLQQVDSVHHLGILLKSDLSWSEHITRICNKTRKLIGLLYRRFHHCHTDMLPRLYKAFIRPHLEYAPQVWDPYFVRDTELLEKTQRFALRVCCKDWSALYYDLLERCQVPSLSDCRGTAKVCHLYKIIHGRLRKHSNHSQNTELQQSQE